MIAIKAKVDTSKLKAAFQTFDATEKKAILDKVVRTDAMGFVRDVIAITPPGNSKKPIRSGGDNGAAAIKQAKIAIYRDLVGGKNKGGSKSQGGIFMPLDDALIAKIQAGLDAGLGNNVRLFVTKDGTVFGSERALFRPDASIEAMFDHHKRYWKNGRMTQAGGRTRDIGRWKFVDKMVVSKSAFQKYKDYVYDKIGILVGGWHAAAKKLKVRVPPIVEKHASGGAEIVIGPSSFIVHIQNSISYALEADVGRRVEWVLNSRKRANRIAKRIEVEIQSALKKRLPK